MQFVPDGPDVPLELLQAHEEGKVVFFAGAGVSVPAGLPLFDRLTKNVSNKLGNMMDNPIVKRAFDAGSFERVFGLLEKEYGPDQVREAMTEELTLEADADINTHISLLDLSRTRNGELRLVTTNFDKAFSVAANGDTALTVDIAPRLPIPKPHTWNSLVHLHGSIERPGIKSRDLVISSADFGSAYLTDGWAAKFVTEMFRHFTVVFIGYSVEDPVMRYIVDALAAERSHSTLFKKAYAFADFRPTQKRYEHSEKEKWEAKNITPILFNARHRFRLLRNSLKQWAETYKDGLSGREQIIRAYSSLKPMGGDVLDSKIQQVCWAIQGTNKNTPYCGNIFAGAHPLPPIEWIDILTEKGILEKPYAGFTPNDGTIPLWKWVLNHMSSRQAINWVLSCDGKLHPHFFRLVNERLKNTQIEAPIRLFWELISGPFYGNSFDTRDVYSLQDQLKLQSADARILREKILYALSPYVIMSAYKPYKEILKGDEAFSPNRLSEFVNLEIGLNGAVHGAGMLRDTVLGENCRKILPNIWMEISSILKRILDLLNIRGDSGEFYDSIYVARPHIDHPENKTYFRVWELLIDVLIESFSLVRKHAAEECELIEKYWLSLRYPLFRRLLIYAYINGRRPRLSKALALLARVDDGLWLWKSSLGGERIDLIKMIWQKGTKNQKKDLVDAILEGPKDCLFAWCGDSSELNRYKKRDVWSLLKLLATLPGKLPARAQKVLSHIVEEFPDWQLSEAEKTGETMAVQDVHQPGEETLPEEEIKSLNAGELYAFLKQSMGVSFFSDRGLRNLLKKEPEWFLKTIKLLKDYVVSRPGNEEPLADKIRVNFWRVALQSLYGNENQSDDFRKQCMSLLVKLDDMVLQEICREATMWLANCSRTLDLLDTHNFWLLWDMLWLENKDEGVQTGEASIGWSLNHPAGVLADALMWQIWQKKPKRGTTLTGVSPNIHQRMNRLVSAEGGKGMASRIMLCSQLHNLFIVEAPWVVERLFPKMDWKNSSEAKELWESYLWQARVSVPFLKEFKCSFLQTANHLGELSQDGVRKYSQLVALIIFENDEVFTDKQIRELLHNLPVQSLPEIPRSVNRFIEGIKEPEKVWNKRVPRVLHLLPKEQRFKSPELAVALAELVTDAGNKFPEAVDIIQHMLVPTASSELMVLIRDLGQRGYAKNYPSSVLDLLDRLVNSDRVDYLDSKEWKIILTAIAEGKPGLKHSAKYKRFSEIVMIRGEIFQ